MEEQSKKETYYGNFVVVANSGLFLTYSISKKFLPLKKGELCILPIKSGKSVKKVVGVFINFCEKPHFNCVEIISKFPFPISFTETHLTLLEWVSEYYVAPIERTLQLLAPSFIWNVDKHDFLEKRLELFQKEKNKKIKGEMVLKSNQEINLNHEQDKVYKNILSRPNSTTLLHGVTGSGKTEVYLKLAQHVISQEKKVLMLVPEIALTPQMSARFRAVFGDALSILHSGLTQVEYVREWLKINYNIPKIVLGVRTAIFCPIKDIGLIIVDEEHDASYKCVETPCYHARDVAVVRAKFESAMCLLGSATPSLESFYNVNISKYYYEEMKEKFSLNQVNSYVINAKDELELKKGYLKTKLLKSSIVEFDDSGLGISILNALKNNKENRQQSMILLNRRGYINYALCAQCTMPLLCPNCSVTTTLHEKGSKELCHYCGFTTATRKICPFCGGSSFLLRGLGTQNIEEKLKNLLPELKVARLDRDTFTSNSRLSQLIDDFRQGETDCLIGTQLLAKGHDFPKVTLVIILYVEDSLFLPDFRSAERTFQLITQAMGRAGRGELQGKVMLQSFILRHPVVEYALANNIQGFFERELKLRKVAWHPPFSRQILCEIRHTNLIFAQRLADRLCGMLIKHWKEKGFSHHQVRLVGPYQATIEKIKTQFRVQICISFMRNFHPKNVTPKNIWEEKDFLKFLKIDVDPLSFM